MIVDVLRSSSPSPQFPSTMVKLASARECRQYGSTRHTRRRNEYMNAGSYLFSTVILLIGYVAHEFSREPRSSLALLLIALVLITAVNLHDLLAHLAGIDYRFLSMVELDPQLAAVEVAVPIIHCIGSGLSFLGILILLIQDGNGDHANAKLETHALNLLIAGPALWLMGSILNSCQVYERADGHFQILQQLVHIPFLTASVLFLMAGIINHQHQPFKSDHRFELLGRYWVWLGITGSGLLFTGGFANVLKVFKMQNSDMRLEKLRGGAQERLMLERDGQPNSSSSSFATEAWCYPRRKFQPTDPLLLPNYEPTNSAGRS